MTPLSLLASLALPALSHAAWNVIELHCHDSDCAAGAITFGFDFDNGAGLRTGCGTMASVWAPPNDWMGCEDESVEWKFTAGEKFEGCDGFGLELRMAGEQQVKHLGVFDEKDGYGCTQLVNPGCGASACQSCGNTECYGYNSVFEPDSTAENDMGFRPGWCGVHVTHHQKEDPNNPDSHYSLDVTLFDANGKEIGKVEGQDAPSGVPVNVGSLLPQVFTVTAQNVDDDPVLFSYNGASWDSNSGQFHFGKYDSGDRDGDGGFTC